MKHRILFTVMALAVALPAAAADWAMIVKDKTRRIEIDRDSVLQSDPGTKVAWGRIVLSAQDADEAGYATVKALNRYDCKRRNFSTIKRVYLDAANHVIREERVTEERVIEVNPRSVDEGLWREVCKPPAAMDVASLAEAASKAAQKTRPEKNAPEAASVRHADQTRAADQQPTKTQVADSHAAAPQTPAPAVEHAAPAAKAPQTTALPADQVEVQTLGKGQSLLPPIPSFGPKTPAAPVAESPEAKPAMPEVVAAPTPAPKPAPVVVAAPVVKPAPPVMRAAPKPAPRVVRAPRPKPAAIKVAMLEEKHEPSTVDVHKSIHWDYEGVGGPARWGQLNPAWKTCDTGKRQSPIDIRDGIRVDLEPIKFDYVPTYFRILNNGHTVQVSVGPGNTMSVMGRTFDLVQFHFHRPSEERINGRGFDMVAHLVHKDLDGRLAVVAVLIERGESHPLVQTLWNNLPLEKHHDYAPAVSVNAAELLPQAPEYYTYMGSLTTPPCSEDVLWMVMKEPIKLSSEQIAIFQRLYPMNARPVQAANDRLIKGSR
ncbi:carbonic anhydrase [Denitromonas ohlonensis]|uniref:carbonic anhydrase n=2 Tax=Denitromonas TaxID=139331 RepID=A0A557R585_9RHOO|nr:carbonic anhydrase family protein [Denitromonas ohlonensis]TVO60294.1 carbonic anhydrase family protein [Denitromonas ohlonensis]TVO75727.1 carbonic anhydrase family protein [Denitromonas ohlonensis]TVT47053.1 MAG: carbonic anhydrase family protein [Denitromonas halophila]TVT65273.1 MAG: carbonic anhydrase family protein [Denitromonas halophila]